MLDILALQRKVARAIAEQIRIKLTPQEKAVLENVKVVNPEAYENIASQSFCGHRKPFKPPSKMLVSNGFEVK